ncbi:hypothetical protein BO71DRAFT_483184 [Aspergillus ellipticus CBS 707.79]|uniref:Uncharacterized protein n=1 Tax=Aspergillus ellipticus CBS 707.79 TaxID=1448320 RepID=A0A319DCP5_9EURO|nr:hypothetical protein BO71DRAFT_483184 [Aspergillus ellipticus CBS 707.79]
MMAFMVDLGKDHFTSPTSLFTLTLCASAQMLLSEGEATSTTNTAHFNKLLDSGELWISSAPELKLHITITASATMIPTVSAFASRIGEILVSSSEPKDPEASTDTELSTFIEELEELDEREENSSAFTSQESFFESNYSATQPEQLYTLLTTSLESLFFGHHRQDDNNDNAHENPENRNLQCLSKIAPSLFSPGYHRAMLQRSQLIPSLEKSITSMLRLPMNQSLQHKINHLKEQNTPQSSVTDRFDTKNVLRASLWRIAQKQLYNPQAAQKLSLIESVSNLRTKYQVWEDTLITDSQPGEMEYMHDDPVIYEDSGGGSLLDTDGDGEDLGPQMSDQESCLISLDEECLASSMGTLRFSPSEEGVPGSWQFGEDTASRTPFSSSSISEKNFDGGDYMLCDLI